MAKDKSVQITISADVKRALDAFDSVGKGVMRFGTEAEKIGKSLDSVFAPLMKGLTLAVGAISTGIGTLTKSALNVGGDFEMVMARIQGVSKGTKEDFDALEAKARELGEKLPISAKQAAEGMYNLAQAGMTAAESLDAIDGVTGLAIAQNYDLAQSSALVVATLRSFGLEVDQAGRIADVFNNAISSSMLSMDKLNNAMTSVAPVARQLGISLEETVAMMGKLADAGMQGPEIGTALRNMMLNLVKPSKEAGGALERLGVAVMDASGRMRPMTDILQDLKNANMSVADATAIFGKRAAASSLILAEAAKDLKEYTKEVGELGKTQEMLAKMMETFANRVEEVKSAYQETLLVMFDQIKDKAKDVTQTIRDIILAFNEWARETELFRKISDAIFEGFGIVTREIEGFKSALRAIDVDAIAARFKGFAEGVRALFDAFARLAEKVPWRLLAEHLDKITYFIVTGWAASKITIIVSGIAGLAGTFMKLSKALFELAKAQAAVEGGTLLKGLSLGSLKTFSVGLAGALALITAFPDALADNADNAKLWTEAIKGNMEALAKLSKEEQAFIREKYGVGDKLKEEADKAEAAVVAVNENYKAFLDLTYAAYQTEAERMSQLVAGFSVEINEALKEGGGKGVKDFLASFGELPDDMAAMMKNVVDTVKEASEQMGAGSEGAKSFAQSVSMEIQAAITEYQTYANEMTARTRELIDETGVNAKEAWALLEADLEAKAAETSKKLTDEFGNPSVAQAFADAFGRMAQAGGDQMTLRIANALNNVKSAIREISAESKKAIDTFIADLEAKAPAYSNMQLTQVRETLDHVIFMAENAQTKILRVYDKNTGEIRELAETLNSMGRDTPRAFEQAAASIDAAGRKSGTAWEKGAVKPLGDTASKAESTAAALEAIAVKAQTVSERISTMAKDIEGVVKAMGDTMVTTFTSALDSLRATFERVSFEIGQLLGVNINSALRNAIPSMSATAQMAGQQMGQSMGRAMEMSMQGSISNITQMIAALERRIAAARAAAASASSSGVSAAALQSNYAREG